MDVIINGSFTSAYMGITVLTEIDLMVVSSITLLLLERIDPKKHFLHIDYIHLFPSDKMKLCAIPCLVPSGITPSAARFVLAAKHVLRVLRRLGRFFLIGQVVKETPSVDFLEQ